MLRKDFLWGGAVTAHQSEGGYTEGGKIPAVCDLTSTGEFSDFKDGIDAYHRYREDFDLFQEMGFNAYRFSIDWSRMMSDENTYNEAGFEFYDQFIDALIERGMEPIPTLYHFEMPVENTAVPTESVYPVLFLSLSAGPFAVGLQAGCSRLPAAEVRSIGFGIPFFLQ